MRKIGEGWQYEVFDLGNGRILKKFKNSYIKRFAHIYFHSGVDFRTAIKETKRMLVEVKESFRILNNSHIPPELIGNPMFLPNFDYIQDKVTPVKDIINGVDIKRGKEIVDEFVAFNHLILTLGFADLSFRMAANFAYDQKGKMILSDIGEIITDPARILAQRKARYWYFPYVEDDIKNEEIRKYYREEMDKHFGL